MSRRVSFEQLEMLWDFLNNHKDIAMGYNKSAQARSTSRRMWTEVAQTLNSVVGGVIKDCKGWAAYWVDYKGKLKLKCASIRTAHTRTGGGPAETLSLTEIEKKILSILGDDYGLGLPGIQIDPFDIEIIPLPHSPVSQSVLAVPGTSDAVDVIVDAGPALADFPILDIDVPVEPPCIPQPTELEQNSAQPRRVRRRPVPMAQETARRLLVESSLMRAQATQDGSTTLREILNVLSQMAASLQSIENRLAALPTNDQ